MSDQDYRAMADRMDAIGRESTLADWLAENDCRVTVRGGSNAPTISPWVRRAADHRLPVRTIYPTVTTSGADWD